MSTALVDALDPPSFFGFTDAGTHRVLLGGQPLTAKVFDDARRAMRRNAGRPDQQQLLLHPRVMYDFDTYRLSRAAHRFETFALEADLGDDILWETRGGPKVPTTREYYQHCVAVIVGEAEWNRVLRQEVPSADPQTWGAQLLTNLEAVLA